MVLFLELTCAERSGRAVGPSDDLKPGEEELAIRLNAGRTPSMRASLLRLDQAWILQP